MPLSFDALREANVRRCVDAYHPIATWSESDWACAVAGEVGEMCHVIKLRRRDGRIDFQRDELARELADILIYADLLASRVGIDLGEAVRETFNAKSCEVGSEVML